MGAIEMIPLFHAEPRASTPVRRRTRSAMVSFAGGGMAPALQKEVVEVFNPAKLFVMYGSTEASPRLTYVEPAMLPQKWGSIGRAIPNVEVVVVDEQGHRLLSGAQGHIAAASSSIAAGRTAPRPDPPEGLRVVSRLPRKVALGWRPSNDPTVKGYIVLRSPGAAGPFEPIAELDGRHRTHYVDRGLAVTLCTDSWLMCGVSLTDEYWLAHTALGFTRPDIDRMILTGFESAFLPWPERERLVASVRDELAAIR
jgi:acyl-CoA synthetase (AMP-forming)/AMP-acid ligase II